MKEFERIKADALEEVEYLKEKIKNEIKLAGDGANKKVSEKVRN